MNFDWQNIISNYNDLPDFIKSNINKSEFNINKILNYDCDNEKEKLLKLLEKDTIEMNKICSLLNILELINDNDIVQKCNLKVRNYNNKLKLNSGFLKKILYFNKLNNGNLKNYQKKFIENIVRQIQNNNNILNKIFTDGFYIENTNINIYNLNNILINLNKIDRIEVINKYNNNIYEFLMNTLVSRFKESDFNYSNNYFLYKNKINNAIYLHIKNFINDLIKTINLQLSKQKINKNYDYDDLLVYENNFNFKNISVNTFLENITKFFNDKFKIKLVLSKSNNKWSKDTIIYEVHKDNKIFGHIYLDLIKNNKSIKPNVPIYININSPYNNEIGQSAIFGAYENLSREILSFNKAQKLFVEFMLAIFNLYNYDTFGFNNFNNEQKNIIELLGEKIFQNEDFISEFYNINLSKYPEKIEELRLLKLIKFRYTCLDSLFDMGLHIDNTITKCNFKIIFEKSYKEIYKCYSIENFNYFNLNPTLFYKILNEQGGIYYNNIFNDIITHNVSNYIINKKIGNQFFENITNNNLSFIENFKNFINENNISNKNINFIIKILSKDFMYKPSHKKNIVESEINNYEEL